MAAHASSFRIEGGLFPSDFAERLTSKVTSLDGLLPKDYGKEDAPERDEAIQNAFNQTLAAWRRFQANLAQAPKTDTQTSLTRDRFLLPLFEALGYGRLPVAKAQKLGERTYAISHQWMCIPIHLLGVAVDLDRRDRGIRGASQASPHGLVQEYLNSSDQVLWAMLSNGHTLRLLRDHKSLTRNAYVEFDLERICEDEDYSGFALLWLLCHSSRAASDKPETCWWEKWYEQSRQDGVRALDRLRDGVKKAIETLGSGFLEHPHNQALSEALKSGALTTDNYYRLLLRLIYRLLFLFVAEDRGVLLQSREEFEGARKLFAAHYGTDRLRRLAAAIRGTAHGDLWQVLRLVMDKLGDGGCVDLALPDLGPGFWGKDQLGLLGGAELHNVRLLDAVRALAFTEERGVLHPVRYRDLGATEFGSVYESLLELKPQQVKAEVFTLEAAAGNERKTTGSYYTPDSLVQCLLDSALEPLLQRAKAEKDPAAALLDLKVCDPACGSGHFLVAAAHRIAKALAQVRSGDDEPSPVARREAMRDVVARCLYGVDLSEMAVELCKVNLWLEAQAPDLPLAFLDAHIQQGNSLLGATPELLAKGIPDEAMDPLLGDDREFCKQLKKENKARRNGGATLFDVEGKRGFAWGGKTLAKDFLAVEAVADRSAALVREKAEAYGRWAASEARRREELVADAWCSAFVMKKTKDAAPPVTEDLFAKVRDGIGELPAETAAEVKRLGREFRFCHWHLKFPGVFGDGLEKRGFDLVLGNPPWDAMSPDSKEFFSAYQPQIRFEDKDGQARIIERLVADGPIALAWANHCRNLYGQVHFFKQSGAYSLFAPGNLGKGDFNIYRMFVELGMRIVRTEGWLAQIVPENLYNGSNAMAIRKRLIEQFEWARLLGFENAREVWFANVHTAAKFCLYAARKAGSTKAIEASFCIRSMEDLRLAISGGALRLPVSLIEEFSPDALAIMELASQRDIDIATKMYAAWPKFGQKIEGSPHRHYMREVDMGTDRDLFDEDPSGVPVYEGRMIDAFDYRAKGYRSGRGRSAVWADLPFSDPKKSIQPQWYVAPGRMPDRLRRRLAGYRIGFCDVASPSNERSLYAALVPPGCVCGHKVPTITFDGEASATGWYTAVWIAVANSFAIDFAVRMKVSLTMSLTLMDSLPFPRLHAEDPRARSLVKIATQLLSVGPEMDAYRASLVQGGWVESMDRPPSCGDAASRFAARAEIDAIVARDIYGLSREELAHILDTFKTVRERDEKEHGDYRTKLTILNLYDQMAR